MEKDYYEFLKSKIAISDDFGFKTDVGLIEFNDGTKLKPHQRDAINWALLGGKRALFESFGLGKTIQQIIICKEINANYIGKSLIICPLGVKHEFQNDATKKLGITIPYVRNNTEVLACSENIMITNYERVRDGDIDVNQFLCVSLDEASVLRGYGTKTYQTFLEMFKNVKFKFVATATPSPNKYKELIHYAGYLGIMDTGQALTRFFKRDSTKANKLTIHPHKEVEFWLWISSWALFLNSPADLGYDATGYDMPEVKYIYHEIPVDHESAGLEDDGQVKMFRDGAISLKDASTEKRDSIGGRVAKMKEIIDNDKESHYIIWHHLESERHAINKALPECVDIYGSLDYDKREQRVLDFANGNEKYLSTKPSLNGSGCNFQKHCHKAIFLGINYEFNDFIQAVHRIARFLQNEQVEIHVIYTESERQILSTLDKKREQHYVLVGNMIKIIKEFGLNREKSISKLVRTMFDNRKEVKSNLFHAVNDDNCNDVRTIESNSIGLVHTSIPFANHYEYTPTYNDFGHTKSNNEFWSQMDFLTPELHRILIPGRIAAIHVKERVLFSSMTEFSFPTISPFLMETIFHFQKHGFGYMGFITIETDVVRENNQTYRLGWTEQCKDGSKMGVGCPEYVAIFRKQPTSHDNAYSDIPVFKDKSAYKRSMWQIDARGKWNSSGNRLMTPEELRHYDLDVINKRFSSFLNSNIYDFDKHLEIAVELDNIGKLPSTFETLKVPARQWNVWSDINRMNTLNSKQSAKNLMQHICPLQFDIIDRVIIRFSNEGDIVYDPFGGIQSTPYRAIKLKRKGRSSELNTGYWKDGLQYLRAAEHDIMMPSLFDFEKISNETTDIES